MWKDICGYEGMYQVSDTGVVKSTSRIGFDGRNVNERILKPYKMPNGYMTVCLRKDGVTSRMYVHRIVCEAFIDNPDNLPVVNHKDGNKANNTAQNLEWSTYSHNNQHAIDTGLKQIGEQWYNAKLSKNDVIKILQRGKYSTYENIAKEYGVTKATIRDVLTGRTWKSVRNTESSNDHP